MAYSPQMLANAISGPSPAPQMSRPPLTFQGTPQGAPMQLPAAPQMAPILQSAPAASPLPGPLMSMGGWPSSAPQMGAPQWGGGGMPQGGGCHPGGGFGQSQNGMAGALSQIGLPLHRMSPGGG